MSSASSSAAAGAVAAPLAKGWGSFQSPSVELLIHQHDEEYQPPPLPDFANDLPPLPLALQPRADGAAADAGADDAVFGRTACLNSLFLLEPSWTFVNHGAFGATLRPMLRVRNQWSERMEAQPLRFLDREVLPMLVRVTREMAALLGCAPTALTLHTNATTALNIVAQSFSFASTDKILRLSIAYGAVKKMLQLRTAGTVVEVDVPLPLRSRAALLDVVRRALTDPAHQGQWKLAVFDHVASNSAIRLPMRELTALCHEHGVPVLVHGAHGLGSVEALRLAESNVDFYATNCHKWLCNPKGAALLYVAPQWQSRIRPLIVSHGTGAGYCSDFIWTGCQDYAPLLTLLSTLRFWERFGGLHRAVRYNHRLVLRAGRMLARRWGTELLVGNGDAADDADGEADALTGNMICVRLPGPVVPRHDDEHNEIQNRLHFECNIEAPIKLLNTSAAQPSDAGQQPSSMQPSLWIRISSMIYNEMSDYERVAEAVLKIRDGGSGDSTVAPTATAQPPAEPAPSATAVAAAVPTSAAVPPGETPVMLCPDHTQVCIPPGADNLALAREYYLGVLGLEELPRPRETAERPGIWMRCGPSMGASGRPHANVHIGVEDLPADFYSRTKAHIAYSVRGLEGWKERLRARGYPVIPSVQIEGLRRFDSKDPFGNKVEFIEHLTGQAVSAASSVVAVGAVAAGSSGTLITGTSTPYFWSTPRAYSSQPLLRVSVFQGRAVPADVPANLEVMHGAMKRAKAAGAQLLLFPELWISGYDLPKERVHELAITVDGETVRRVGDWCRALQIAVCFGYAERCGEVVFNSAALLDEAGAVVLNYRKCHLWMGGEKSIFAPAVAPATDSLRVVTLEPHGVRVGINICYDVELPETSRVLALQGAQLLLVPTALARGQVHETVPLVVLPTRALDSHLFVAYSNLVGRSHPGATLDFCGLSAIIGPDGVALRRMGDVLPGSGQEHSPTAAAAVTAAQAERSETLPGGDIIVADLLPHLYAKRFETTPLLVDRRPELYTPLAGAQ